MSLLDFYREVSGGVVEGLDVGVSVIVVVVYGSCEFSNSNFGIFVIVDCDCNVACVALIVGRLVESACGDFSGLYGHGNERRESEGEYDDY